MGGDRTTRTATAATAGALALVALASTAHADRRAFTQTYEYSTVPQGNTTVELWHTQTRSTTAAASPQLWEGILELEHGITEHLDIGFHTVLQQVDGGAMASEPLHVARAKLESRFRLSERGELPVDTMLFVGLGKEFGDSIYTIDARIVGARDFGDLTLAVNAVGRLLTGNDLPKDTMLELGWAAGATYQAHNKVRVGIETWGVVDDDENLLIDAGPVLAFAPSSNFWATVTVGFALTERDAMVGGPTHGAYSARAIFGIEL